MSVLNSHIKTEESKSSSENSRTLSSNNPINFQNSKKINLYIRPISVVEKNDEKINKLIYSSFNDPDQFFAVDSPVQIGTRIKLQSMDLTSPRDKHRASYSVRNPPKKGNMSLKVSVTDTSRSLYTIKEKPNPKSFLQNTEFVDNNNLKKIFESYKSKIHQNKNLRKNESSFSRSIKDINNSSAVYNNSKTISEEQQFPVDLYNSLNYQNKRINDELNYSKRIKNISKILSKRSNKKEEDLLFNKVDLFKYKKEILSKINRDKIPDKFIWNNSLRSPPNFKGKREFHINVNSDRNPFWGVLIQRYPNQKELSVKPGYNLNQKEFLRFSEDMNNKNKNKENVNSIKNLDDLNVVGNNLFDVEYKREMSTKGRKILHKAFVENGKAVLNQDINNVFGEKTLYKNYENKNPNNYYLKGNKSDKSIFMNSFSERNENNSLLYNNFNTIPSKV